MPLLAALAANLALGALAALAAARELRASPRPAHRSRAFRAVALHELLVAMPVAAYVLGRLTDWALGYTTDGARIPSVILAIVVVLHGALGLAGFAAGSHWLREHRPRAVFGLVIACVGVTAAGAILGHERLAVVGTWTQFRSGYGMRSLAESGVAATLSALATAWTGAGAHLCWSLARRL
jgi:hypothetical protein